VLAMAEWLFCQGASTVRINPDGMHTKGFDIPNWLAVEATPRLTATGRGQTSGTFRRGEKILIVHSQPGLGDVVATLGGAEVEIETKGGCINTRHPGQLSRLRKGLHEAIGQLMGSPRTGITLRARLLRARGAIVARDHAAAGLAAAMKARRSDDRQRDE
jgi:hypothetical protein